MIPFLDLKAQYHSIKEEIDSAIAGVLESSQFVLGSPVAAFEEEFAQYCGGGQAIGVNSGTSALHLALLAAGVGPGDEVITTPFTFAATVAAIHYCGAAPVLADIDPVSFNLDPARLAAAITEKTKAILPVHLYGHPAEMDAINEAARSPSAGLQREIVVIEDAAQAHGAEYKGRRAGSLSDMACFSFYPTKNLGAYGEGGAVVTSNPEYARAIRRLRNWGQTGRYEHAVRGYNYRLESMQGAILRVKLRHLEAWTAARRAIAGAYDGLLKDAGVVTPVAKAHVRHVYHAYTIRTPDRGALVEGLAAAGIQTGVHYPIPVHLQPAYREARYPEGSLPAAESTAREVVSLPIYPELRPEQVEAVCEAVRQIRVGQSELTRRR
ncbi:MAG TPA: DegT/DnrJ/EryC1/StrS family aminotransferase [Candidatus Acidoferrales bacterium]|nr:DegT/DnrJ/EryC1/StrS family aminotransferase [Candidatus Acidoferrales bacterium]